MYLTSHDLPFFLLLDSNRCFRITTKISNISWERFKSTFIFDSFRCPGSVSLTPFHVLMRCFLSLFVDWVKCSELKLSIFLVGRLSLLKIEGKTWVDFWFSVSFISYFNSPPGAHYPERATSIRCLRVCETAFSQVGLFLDQPFPGISLRYFRSDLFISFGFS